MPQFLGIGAQKCGTSWLYENLHHHPEVKFPGGKEVHFFDRWNMDDQAALDWYMRLFADGGGDITPAYAILERQKISAIKRLFPNVKIIYIIRNPVERAWSAALMGLKMCDMHIDEASDQWFIDHFNSAGSMKRGDYKACINNWLEFYDKNQLLLLNYHDIAKNPEEFITRVANFLNIDADFYSNFPENMLKEKVFSGSGEKIRPSLEKHLADLYQEKLAEFDNILKSCK